LGSLTEPLPFAQPAADGVTPPTSAGRANSLADTSFLKIECINCSRLHAATSWLCPFFMHRFNASALAELQKARLHWIKEAQASKAASKPARLPKGKGKA
ncbi:hypothetical protein AX15_006003, partial [Amanita polypyramis BW_CC]